ncbi:MAG: glycosyltransferase family 2 protein [Patescibacteria group bacterium]
MKICVVIPAYNEGTNIISVLEKTKNFADKIIVIDDGSDQKKMAEINFNVISDKIIHLRHRINLGKGAALKTGCEAAIKLGMDAIVLMDADGQHKPEDIPRLLDKMEREDLDIVFGSRVIGRDMPLMMMLGNKFLSLATSLLFKIYISDTQSGFRAFKAAAYPKIQWNSPRYSVETEMIVNTGKNHLKFGEIEIQTIYHNKYKGTTVFDGLRIFINMLIWKII